MGADDRQKGGEVAGAEADLAGIDRLGAAQRLVRLSAALTVAGLVMLVGDSGGRPRPQLELSARVMARLDLDVPAWVPAGRAARHPSAWRRAVDLRPTPGMFRWDPSVDRLLIEPRLAPTVPPSGREVPR